MSEETVGMLFKLEWTCAAFFGPGDEGFIRWDDCCLVSRLNLWIHVKSPLIIFRRNSGSVLSLPLKSCHMLRQLSYCFSLKQWGLCWWQASTLTLSLTVCWTGPNEVPNMFPTLWIVILLCLRTNSSAQSTYSHVMLVIPAKNLTSSTEIAPLWVQKNHWSFDNWQFQ